PAAPFRDQGQGVLGRDPPTPSVGEDAAEGVSAGEDGGGGTRTKRSVAKLNRSRVLAAMLAVAFVRGVSPSAACSPEDALKTEKECSTITSWPDLYGSYERFAQCDDAAISEGYSNSVGVLLSQHWNELSKFISLATSHPEFQTFVFHHIDLTIPAATL